MIVNISNLPKSIRKVANIFNAPGRWDQLLYGPIEPNPGPILPNADADAVNEVIKSILNEENINAEKININI